MLLLILFYLRTLIHLASVKINPINDAPEVVGDTGDRLFTEDDLGMVLGTFFVEDIDSVDLSQVTIELSNKQENDKLIASDVFWNEPDESVDGKIILTSKARGDNESSTIPTFNQALVLVSLIIFRFA